MVDGNGVVSTVGAGSTTVTAGYTIDNVNQSDTVQVNISIFDVRADFNVRTRLAESPSLDDWSVLVGGNRQPRYVTQLTGPNSQSQSVAESDLSFSFNPAVAGFSVNSTGQVSIAGSVVGGTTANLLVSYTDTNNRTYSDVMIITANSSAD